MNSHGSKKNQADRCARIRNTVLNQNWFRGFYMIFAEDPATSTFSSFMILDKIEKSTNLLLKRLEVWRGIKISTQFCKHRVMINIPNEQMFRIILKEYLLDAEISPKPYKDHEIEFEHNGQPVSNYITKKTMWSIASVRLITSWFSFAHRRLYLSVLVGTWILFIYQRNSTYAILIVKQTQSTSVNFFTLIEKLWTVFKIASNQNLKKFPYQINQSYTLFRNGIIEEDLNLVNDFVVVKPIPEKHHALFPTDWINKITFIVIPEKIHTHRCFPEEYANKLAQDGWSEYLRYLYLLVVFCDKTRVKLFYHNKNSL